MGTEFMLPKIPILDLFSEIGDGIIDALLSLVWGAVTGLMKLLDSLQRAFFLLRQTHICNQLPTYPKRR